MKNNIDTLISEELKKVTLLFKYDNRKTLSENITEQQQVESFLITKNDNAYEYKLEDGKYFFKGKNGTKYGKSYPNWVEATNEKSKNAIKALFDKKPQGDTQQTTNTNSKEYKDKFAQMSKESKKLPASMFGDKQNQITSANGVESPKQNVQQTNPITPETTPSVNPGSVDDWK